MIFGPSLAFFPNSTSIMSRYLAVIPVSGALTWHGKGIRGYKYTSEEKTGSVGSGNMIEEGVLIEKSF